MMLFFYSFLIHPPYFFIWSDKRRFTKIHNYYKKIGIEEKQRKSFPSKTFFPPLIQEVPRSRHASELKDLTEGNLTKLNKQRWRDMWQTRSRITGRILSKVVELGLSWAEREVEDWFLRSHPFDSLGPIVLIEKIHKPNYFFIGQVKQPNLHGICLHPKTYLHLLLLHLDHRILQNLREWLQPILVLGGAY